MSWLNERGFSQADVSRIERGQIATTTVTLLRQLDARFMVEVPLQEDQCLVLPVVSA